MCKPIITQTMCGEPLESFKRMPTPAELAVAFCDMDDREQAEFFVAVAAVGETWEGGFGQWHQWSEVGQHLAECPGAVGGQKVIENMHVGLEYRRAHPKTAPRVQTATGPNANNGNYL